MVWSDWWPKRASRRPDFCRPAHWSGCQTRVEALLVWHRERAHAETRLADPGGVGTPSPRGVRLPCPRLWRGDGARQLPAPGRAQGLHRRHGGPCPAQRREVRQTGPWRHAMSFLAPLFLLGAAALALPVLFHLIRRTSREKITFSS